MRSVSFQFLIGSLITSHETFDNVYNEALFQFLIGSLITKPFFCWCVLVGGLFQFLIGSLITYEGSNACEAFKVVSIPYR